MIRRIHALAIRPMDQTLVAPITSFIPSKPIPVALPLASTIGGSFFWHGAEAAISCYPATSSSPDRSRCLKRIRLNWLKGAGGSLPQLKIAQHQST